METLYRARDGRIFEDENECEDYECSLIWGDVIERKAIAGLDIQGEPLCPSSPDFLTYVTVLRLSDWDAVNAYNALCEQEDRDDKINEPGIYHYEVSYDETTGWWEKIDDIIQGHFDEIEKLEEMKRKVQ